MLNMLGVINDTLETIDLGYVQRTNMWCHTCHRDRPRPLTLGEELTIAYDQSGVEHSLQVYRDLRQNFFGRGSYDFGETREMHASSWGVNGWAAFPGAAPPSKCQSKMFAL